MVNVVTPAAWELRLFFSLSFLTKSNRYAEHLAGKFNTEELDVMQEVYGYEKPSFLAMPIYYVYPRINYVHLLSKIENSGWRTHVIMSLFQDFENQLKAGVVDRKGHLKKILENVIRECFPDVVDALLADDYPDNKEKITTFVLSFSTPEQLYALLNHPSSRNPKNQQAVEVIVGYLHKWDDRYPYKDYPAEWLEQIYNQPIELKNYHEPDAWASMKTDSSVHGR